MSLLRFCLRQKRKKKKTGSATSVRFGWDRFSFFSCDSIRVLSVHFDSSIRFSVDVVVVVAADIISIPAAITFDPGILLFRFKDHYYVNNRHLWCCGLQSVADTFHLSRSLLHGILRWWRRRRRWMLLPLLTAEAGWLLPREADEDEDQEVQIVDQGAEEDNRLCCWWWRRRRWNPIDERLMERHWSPKIPITTNATTIVVSQSFVYNRMFWPFYFVFFFWLVLFGLYGQLFNCWLNEWLTVVHLSVNPSNRPCVCLSVCLLQLRYGSSFTMFIFIFAVK